jgi:hypothetical protein
MNSKVYRLLKGYLARSVWLYALLGLLQFIMTGVYWWRGYDRVPAAGVLLGLWGAVAALNTHSLVWRSLPLTSRDASLFRWWAMAGAPGIFLTLLTLIAWASQRSNGFPAPGAAAILDGLLTTWAALGVLATLLRSSQRPATRLRQAGIAVAVIGSTLLLGYGLPVGSDAQPYSIVFGYVGVTLLLVSAVRAHRGVDWRWPDLADRGARSARLRSTLWGTHRYGIGVILIPLAQRTAIFAVVATVIIVSLQRVFPRASIALFWVYFIGLSTAGFLLTYQVRRAFQPLRCLPLSAKQLAGWLQLLGALPGLVTLGLTLLINRAVLNAGLDVAQVAAFAFVIIPLQALPLFPMKAPHRNTVFGYSVTLYQRIFVPAYLGLMAASWKEAYGRFTWMRWPLWTAGVCLCVIGYFVFVHQLRAGIRPSSNEDVFSPG